MWDRVHNDPFRERRGSLLLQPAVLGFGRDEDGNVGAGLFPERQEYWHVLRFGLLQEYNIGIDVAADETESLAIEGPVKVPDAFGFEVGELLSRRTVEWLEPKRNGGDDETRTRDLCRDRAP